MDGLRTVKQEPGTVDTAHLGRTCPQALNLLDSFVSGIGPQGFSNTRGYPSTSNPHHVFQGEHSRSQAPPHRVANAYSMLTCKSEPDNQPIGTCFQSYGYQNQVGQPQFLSPAVYKPTLPKLVRPHSTGETPVRQGPLERRSPGSSIVQAPVAAPQSTNYMNTFRSPGVSRSAPPRIDLYQAPVGNPTFPCAPVRRHSGTLPQRSSVMVAPNANYMNGYNDLHIRVPQSPGGTLFSPIESKSANIQGSVTQSKSTNYLNGYNGFHSAVVSTPALARVGLPQNRTDYSLVTPNRRQGESGSMHGPVNLTSKREYSNGLCAPPESPLQRTAQLNGFRPPQPPPYRVRPGINMYNPYTYATGHTSTSRPHPGYHEQQWSSHPSPNPSPGSTFEEVRSSNSPFILSPAFDEDIDFPGEQLPDRETSLSPGGDYSSSTLMKFAEQVRQMEMMGQSRKDSLVVQMLNRPRMDSVVVQMLGQPRLDSPGYPDPKPGLQNPLTGHNNKGVSGPTGESSQGGLPSSKEATSQLSRLAHIACFDDRQRNSTTPKHERSFSSCVSRTVVEARTGSSLSMIGHSSGDEGMLLPHSRQKIISPNAQLKDLYGFTTCPTTQGTVAPGSDIGLSHNYFDHPRDVDELKPKSPSITCVSRPAAQETVKAISISQMRSNHEDEEILPPYPPKEIISLNEQQRDLPKYITCPPAQQAGSQGDYVGYNSSYVGKPRDVSAAVPNPEKPLSVSTPSTVLKKSQTGTSLSTTNHNHSDEEFICLDGREIGDNTPANSGRDMLIDLSDQVTITRILNPTIVALLPPDDNNIRLEMNVSDQNGLAGDVASSKQEIQLSLSAVKPATVTAPVDNIPTSFVDTSVVSCTSTAAHKNPGEGTPFSAISHSQGNEEQPDEIICLGETKGDESPAHFGGTIQRKTLNKIPRNDQMHRIQFMVTKLRHAMKQIAGKEREDEKLGQPNCPKCGQICDNIPDLKLHYFQEHVNVQKPQFRKCFICHSKFKKKLHLQEHIRRIHKKEKNFICEKCGKTTYDECELNTHIRRKHKKERNGEYTLCQRTFNSTAGLENHVTTHTGEKTHKYSVCSVRIR